MRKGFTLIELLVVIAIIGILAVMVISGLQRIEETSGGQKIEKKIDSFNCSSEDILLLEKVSGRCLKSL